MQNRNHRIYSYLVLSGIIIVMIGVLLTGCSRGSTVSQASSQTNTVKEKDESKEIEDAAKKYIQAVYTFDYKAADPAFTSLQKLTTPKLFENYKKFAVTDFEDQLVEKIDDFSVSSVQQDGEKANSKVHIVISSTSHNMEGPKVTIDGTLSLIKLNGQWVVSDMDLVNKSSLDDKLFYPQGNWKGIYTMTSGKKVPITILMTDLDNHGNIYGTITVGSMGEDISSVFFQKGSYNDGTKEVIFKGGNEWLNIAPGTVMITVSGKIDQASKTMSGKVTGNGDLGTFEVSYSPVKQ